MEWAWGELEARWAWSERLLFTVGMVAAHNAAFYGYNLVLHAVVYRVGWFQKYKILPAGRWPPRALVKKAYVHAVIDHWVLGPVLFWYLYPLFRMGGMSTAAADVPSVWLFAAQFAAAMAMCDAIFIVGHAALHTPWLYRHVHKRHHEFNVSIGVAAEYAHPLEGAWNILSTLLPTLLVGMHMSAVFLYLFVRILETVDAHSGYCLPANLWCSIAPAVQGGPLRHDFHHSANIGNYGKFAYIDAICGSNAAYERARARGRREAPDPLDPKAH